jgi:hypothetical protein
MAWLEWSSRGLSSLACMCVLYSCYPLLCSDERACLLGERPDGKGGRCEKALNSDFGGSTYSTTTHLTSHTNRHGSTSGERPRSRGLRRVTGSWLKSAAGCYGRRTCNLEERYAAEEHPSTNLIRRLDSASVTVARVRLLHSIWDIFLLGHYSFYCWGRLRGWKLEVSTARLGRDTLTRTSDALQHPSLMLFSPTWLGCVGPRI